MSKISMLFVTCVCLWLAACDPEEEDGGGGGTLEGGQAGGGEGGGGENGGDEAGGESEPGACTADAMQCPDGSYVGRDPNDNCDFAPCPAEPHDGVVCAADVRECPDGSTVSRDPEDDCQFPACPGESDGDDEGDEDDVLCAADVRECDDGSTVGRDPEQDCAFELCPGECRNPETGEPDTTVECFADPCSVNDCAAHPEAECTADYCGGCHAIFTDESGEAVECELVACTADAKQCPDGSWVSRDGSNNCEWEPCP